MTKQKVTFFTILIIFVLVVSGCKGKVEQAKNMVWEGDKSLTVGKALDNYKYFEKKSWTVQKTDNGKEFVEFNGLLDPTERINKIIKKTDSARQKVDKLEKRISEDGPKITANDIYTMGYYWKGCFRSSNQDEENKCGEQGAKDLPDAIKQASSESEKVWYHNCVIGGFEEAKKTLENDKKGLKKYDDELQYYKDGNRVKVIYQFMLQQDKTVEIQYGGYKVKKDDEDHVFGDHLRVLSEIYKNEPIYSEMNATLPEL